MADSLPSPTVEGGVRRFLTFRLERRLYALPTEDVVEVIRVPAVARLPQGPKSLLGIANLRGSVLPILTFKPLPIGSPPKAFK